MRSAGVDGCRGGWVVAFLCEGEPLSLVHCRSFDEVLAAVDDCAAVGVDMPIGLPEVQGVGGRLCDRLARKRLGPRRASIFSAPARSVLGASDYAEACALNVASSEGGRKISIQSWNIVPKIREVDAAMTPSRQRRVVEVHPELSFQEMNGGEPLERPKSTGEGLYLRLRLLDRVVGVTQEQIEAAAATLSGPAGLDDMLDAIAAAWTASRVAEGTASRLPETPPKDARGLRMEICA